MIDSMQILADAAHKFGGVDVQDEDAVIDFLERHSDQIPDAEAEQIVMALEQRNEHRPEEATEAPEVRDFDYPALDDAKRDAKLYEQLQQIRLDRASSRALSVDTLVLRLQRNGQIGQIVSGAALAAILVFSAAAVSRSSALRQMLQTGIAVAASVSIISALNLGWQHFMRRLFRRETMTKRRIVHEKR